MTSTNPELEAAIDALEDAASDYALSEDPDSIPGDHARSALRSLYSRLQQEIEEAREILASAVDRDRDPKDTLRALAVTASNGIFWRDRELSQLRGPDRLQLTPTDIGFILSGEYGPRTCPCRACVGMSKRLDAERQRLSRSASPGDTT